MISDALHEAIVTIRTYYMDDPDAERIVAVLDEMRAYQQRDPSVPCASFGAFLSAPYTEHMRGLVSTARTVREALAGYREQENQKARTPRPRRTTPALEWKFEQAPNLLSSWILVHGEWEWGDYFGYSACKTGVTIDCLGAHPARVLSLLPTGGGWIVEQGTDNAEFDALVVRAWGDFAKRHADELPRFEWPMSPLRSN